MKHIEEMPKNYDPQTAEPELIERWMSAGCYQRSKGVGDCTVVIPPPNVTGILHMGHAMDDSIQDTYVRDGRLHPGHLRALRSHARSLHALDPGH